MISFASAPGALERVVDDTIPESDPADARDPSAKTGDIAHMPTSCSSEAPCPSYPSRVRSPRSFSTYPSIPIGDATEDDSGCPAHEADARGGRGPAHVVKTTEDGESQEEVLDFAGSREKGGSKRSSNGIASHWRGLLVVETRCFDSGRCPLHEARQAPSDRS